MIPKNKVGISSLLALAICSFVAIGAPPSHFVQQQHVWTRLEPLMWLSLFSGPAFSLIACVLAIFSVRASAAACMIGVAMSVLGLTLAWTVDAEAGFRGLVLPIAFLAVPFIGGVEATRHSARNCDRSPRRSR